MGVRITGNFSNPKGVRDQKSLRNTGLNRSLFVAYSPRAFK